MEVQEYMDSKDQIRQLFTNEKYNSLPVLLNALNSLLRYNIQTTDSVSVALIDTDFLEEIRNVAYGNVPIYFGKTLRNLKCVIHDENGRGHEICFCYNGYKRLSVTSTMIPHTPLQDREFSSIEEIIITFRRHIDTLTSYFYELEHIDRFFTIVEPLKPSFKDDYRRILLAYALVSSACAQELEKFWEYVTNTLDLAKGNERVIMCGDLNEWVRTKRDSYEAVLGQYGDKRVNEADHRAWLHIEVTPDGMATNIHLVGQGGMWSDKLQEGLTTWDHDKDIVDNIMTVFDLVNFPAPSASVATALPKNSLTVDVQVCNICLCDELPDQSGVPQPLCQNSVCGVYFHRNCLFQWLVACSGGRHPAFGVATGSCPNCLQPISCSEKD